MSSHHIVREKQEPALLVMSLDNFPDELLGQLLEWSPTVIAVPEIAETLAAYGIKIDWLIADSAGEVFQSDIKLLSPGPNNAIDTALEYLSENEYPSVNIITDELKISDYEHFVNRINLAFFNGHQKIYPVISGFSKWKPAGELIGILDPPDHLTVSGLLKINPHLYQTTSDSFFALEFEQPFLFISEEI